MFWVIPGGNAGGAMHWKVTSTLAGKRYFPSKYRIYTEAFPDGITPATGVLWVLGNAIDLSTRCFPSAISIYHASGYDEE